jgi:hypothetical protein
MPPLPPVTTATLPLKSNILAPIGDSSRSARLKQYRQRQRIARESGRTAAHGVVSSVELAERSGCRLSRAARHRADWSTIELRLFNACSKLRRSVDPAP